MCEGSGADCIAITLLLCGLWGGVGKGGGGRGGAHPPGRKVYPVCRGHVGIIRVIAPLRLPADYYSSKGIPRTPTYTRFYLMLHKMSLRQRWKPHLLLRPILLHPEGLEELAGENAVHYTLPTDKLLALVSWGLVLVGLGGLYGGRLQVEGKERRQS